MRTGELFTVHTVVWRKRGGILHSQHYLHEACSVTHARVTHDPYAHSAPRIQVVYAPSAYMYSVSTEAEGSNSQNGC